MFKKKKLKKILVSENSYNDNDPYKVIASNISIINVLREEGIDFDEIHDDAVISYYVDYYLTQMQNENFAKFIWNIGFASDILDHIATGLEKMQAEEHLSFFEEMCEKTETFADSDLEAFLENDYSAENEITKQLQNYDFKTLEENLVELNSCWLKNHSDLKPLNIDVIFAEIEKFTGKKISKY